MNFTNLMLCGKSICVIFVRKDYENNEVILYNLSLEIIAALLELYSKLR